MNETEKESCACAADGSEALRGLGLPPSPCENCPVREGCHKPVNPDVKTTCRKWNEWFWQVWPAITERIRGDKRR